MRCLLFFLFILLTTITAAQPGALDASFGTGGIVTTQLNTSTGYSDMAIQPDHKILCVGSQLNAFTKAAVVRYQYNGSIDSSFGTNGVAYPSLYPDEVQLNAIALQPDGKIVVAGYYHQAFSDYDFITARYNPDGSLDASFNGTGVVTTSLSNFPDYAYAVAVQTDGKILVSGYMYNQQHAVFAVVRYTTNGQLDTSFDGDGIDSINVATSHNYSYYLSLQPDGKIILGGCSTDIDSLENFAVVRLLANGSRDSSFGGDGIVTIDNGGRRDIITYITVMPDGKLLACGSSATTGSTQLVKGTLLRLNSNGTTDSSFASNGIAMTGLGNGYDLFQALALQSDGKITVGGITFNGSNTDFLLLRYNANGTPDNSFDGDGIVTTPIGTGYDNAGVIKLDGNRIYLAGYATAPNNFQMGAVAAYLNDGLPLPLRLIDFSAVRQPQQIRLRWQTSFEENMTGFKVQRSMDGRTFENIGMVAAFNHTNGAAYSFNDPCTDSRTRFYRLQMTGAGNSDQFSRTVKVSGSTKQEVQLFPNPVADNLSVMISGFKERALIKIVDMSGQILSENIRNLSGSTSFSLPVINLKPGLYYLILYTSSGTVQQRFIKR